MKIKEDISKLPLWKQKLIEVADNRDYIEENIAWILTELKNDKPDTSFMREKLKNVETWFGEIDKFVK